MVGGAASLRNTPRSPAATAAAADRGLEGLALHQRELIEAVANCPGNCVTFLPLGEWAPGGWGQAPRSRRMAPRLPAAALLSRHALQQALPAAAAHPPPSLPLPPGLGLRPVVDEVLCRAVAQHPGKHVLVVVDRPAHALSHAQVRSGWLAGPQPACSFLVGLRSSAGASADAACQPGVGFELRPTHLTVGTPLPPARSACAPSCACPPPSFAAATSSTPSSSSLPPGAGRGAQEVLMGAPRDLWDGWCAGAAPMRRPQATSPSRRPTSLPPAAACWCSPPACCCACSRRAPTACPRPRCLSSWTPSQVGAGEEGAGRKGG